MFYQLKVFGNSLPFMNTFVSRRNKLLGLISLWRTFLRLRYCSSSTWIQYEIGRIPKFYGYSLFIFTYRLSEYKQNTQIGYLLSLKFVTFFETLIEQSHHNGVVFIKNLSMVIDSRDATIFNIYLFCCT